MEIAHGSLAEQSRALAGRKVSAVELPQAHLDRIESHRNLNAFLDVRPEVTLAQAAAADTRRAQGTATPLTGVPIAHKDIFVTKDFFSTASSKILQGYRSPFDATVVDTATGRHGGRSARKMRRNAMLVKREHRLRQRAERVITAVPRLVGG